MALDDYFVWSGYVRLIGCCILVVVLLAFFLLKEKK